MLLQLCKFVSTIVVGMPSPDDEFQVCYGERMFWCKYFKVVSNSSFSLSVISSQKKAVVVGPIFQLRNLGVLTV